MEARRTQPRMGWVRFVFFLSAITIEEDHVSTERSYHPWLISNFPSRRNSAESFPA
jgi:hypothetical protein